MNFKRVGILGAGLLGGSVALALKKFAPHVEIRLWGRRDTFFSWAEEHGVDQFSTDLEATVKGLDLVILCTPVGFMSDLVARILKVQSSDQPLLITDVGSVKAVVSESVREVIKESGQSRVEFIGSHPMAGSEKSGCQDACAELFVDKPCVIEACESDDQALPTSVVALESFWQQLGANTIRMEAEVHDHAVAAISHFPHAIASLTTEVALRGGPSVLSQVAGNGFLDTTRIASGNAAMWTEIMLSNREALLDEMEAMKELCESFSQVLKNNDEGALLTLLESAKQKRDSFSPRKK